MVDGRPNPPKGFGLPLSLLVKKIRQEQLLHPYVISKSQPVSTEPVIGS